MGTFWAKYRPVGLVLLVVLALSGCTPGDRGRVVTDVALDADGRVVEIDSDDTDGLELVGAKTSACLDDGACFRLVDERAIEESRDGWQTSETVWEISPTSDWWKHHFDDGTYDMVIGVYDIVATPDQTVVVASGQLPLIQRSVDGAWTPSVATLRTLPKQSWWLAGWAAFASLIIGLGLGIASGSGPGSSHGIVGALLVIPWILALAWFPLSAGSGFPAILLTPLALFGLGRTLTAVEEAPRGFLRSVAPKAVAIVMVAVGAWAAVYALWSSDRIAWGLLLLLGAASFAISTAAVAAFSEAAT